LVQPWGALGGRATIAVSGDERASRLSLGKNPFADKPLPCPAVYVGEGAGAPLPEDLKSSGSVALVDMWDPDFEQINALRPLKVALMEDDGDVHEAADLLFQPYLDGVKWGNSPIRTENGKKLRPFEEQRGGCRVLKGAAYIVLSPLAAQMRPNREAAQPLNVKKLLVTFGGTDGPGLAPRAYEIMSRLVAENGWGGKCTLLAPGGKPEGQGAGSQIYVSPGLPELTKCLTEFDAVWCAGGVTLAECLCLGIPVAAWPQNERQQRMIADIALEGACINLGIGTEADPDVVREALADWLGPLGQETRQEQAANGMALVDGSGASRVAQELWKMGSI
jgi:hypothetical protein